MRLAAFLAHVVTALGAVCALLALEAVIAKEWEVLFWWLGAALVIDAIDGPYARFIRVTERLPRFSGERLDLVIDYLTYVFVPAVAMREAGFLDGVSGNVLTAAVLVSSLYHFADLESKAADQSFIGFPALWNVVAFYLFAFGAAEPVAQGIVALCVALTFVPSKWVHPVRVRALRPLTLVLTGAWAVAAVAVLWRGFASPPSAALWVLALVACYAILLPLVWPRIDDRWRT